MHRAQAPKDSRPFHDSDSRSSSRRLVDLEPPPIALAESLDLRARRILHGAHWPRHRLNHQRRAMKTFPRVPYKTRTALPELTGTAWMLTANGVGRSGNARRITEERGGIQLPITERPSQCQLPAVDAGLEAPKGPGTGGNKPLMRNRRAPMSATAIGLLPATLCARPRKSPGLLWLSPAIADGEFSTTERRAQFNLWP